MLDIYRKMYCNNDLLTFFVLHKFSFEENNLRSVLKRMSTADSLAFPADVKNIDWYEFLRRLILGMRLYTANDHSSTLPAARKRLVKLKIVHYLLKDTVLLYLLYYLCTRLIDFVMSRWDF